jgi:uncharacterized protein YqfB (UPF0267 family)
VKAPNVQVELVHDPLRHRLVVGRSGDLALIRVTAEQLIFETEERAQRFEGIDDVHAAQERAEVERLRRILRLILPEEGPR